MTLIRCIGDEQGSIALYFIVIASAIIMAMGLVVDGGRKMARVQEALHLADNAARACGQHIDQVSAKATTRGDIPKLDVPTARQAASDFLASAGVVPHSVSFTDGDTRCVVTVRLNVDTLIIPIGPVSSTQSAQGRTG